MKKNPNNQKTILIVVVSLMLSFLFKNTYYKKIDNKIKANERMIITKEIELTTSLMKEREIDNLKKEIEEYSIKEVELKKRFYIKKNISKFAEDIISLEKKSDVKYNKLEIMDEKKEDKQYQEIEIAFVGNYSNLIKYYTFFKELDKEISIKSSLMEKSGDEILVDIKFRALIVDGVKSYED